MSKRSVFATTRYAVAVGLIFGANCSAQAACLAAPDAAAPEGQHWHYRVDRATKQNCWYLREAAPQTRLGDLPQERRASRVSGEQTVRDVPPLSRSSREALFREFLEWRKSQPPP